MKKGVYLLVFVFVIVASVYVLLFTGAGNSLLRPVIESKINENLPKKVKLQNFKLTPSSLNIKILIDKNSFIKAYGDYNLFSKSFDIKYDIKISDLSTIAPLIDMKFRGPFSTTGNAKGDLSLINIKGNTDIARSKSYYKVVLKDLNPSNVIANIDSLHIEDILYMFYQPRFIKGSLNAKINLIDLDPKNLKGDLKAAMNDGMVDIDVMKKDFNITLPNTTVKLYTEAKLDKTTIDYSAKVVSNLAKINSDGKIDSKDLRFDIKYALNIKELAILKPIIKTDIRGPFETNGKVKGDKKLLKIVGKSDVAKSDTTYNISLKDFSPKSADIDIKGAKLSNVLYMINQPSYADAVIDMNAKLSNLDIKNLTGDIKTVIKNGKTNPKVLYKEFNLTDAKISFNGSHYTSIKKSIATSKVKIVSSIAKINANKSVYDINRNILTSDFTLYIPDLDKLYFATKKHMRGDIKIAGDIKKDKDLIVNAHTNTLGGRIDFKLVNDEVSKTVRGIKVTALTDMLMYPKIFDSTMDADVKYNLKTKKGTINAKLLKGRILPNQMTYLLSQMAKFDITKEIYEVTTIDSKIDNMVVLSDLDMKSRLTHITSKKALLDMNKNRVNTKLRIDIKDKPVYVKIKGDINKPKVSIDAGAMLKKEIEKKLEKKLDKKIPKEFQEPLKQILKIF